MAIDTPLGNIKAKKAATTTLGRISCQKLVPTSTLNKTIG
jgi:hypothetical protein